MHRIRMSSRRSCWVSWFIKVPSKTFFTAKPALVGLGQGREEREEIFFKKKYLCGLCAFAVKRFWLISAVQRPEIGASAKITSFQVHGPERIPCAGGEETRFGDIVHKNRDAQHGRKRDQIGSEARIFRPGAWNAFG